MVHNSFMTLSKQIYSSGLSCAEVEYLVDTEYGLKVKAELLPGYKDQNFKLNSLSGQQYIFKACFDEQAYDELDLENQAMLFLHKHAEAVCVPLCIENRKGEMITCLQTSQGVAYVRLLRYLPGRFMVDTVLHSDKLLEAIGAYFGRIDYCLQGFFHVAAYRSLPWDLKRVYEVIQARIADVEDSDKRRLIERLMEDYRLYAAPKLACLRSSVIHNDGNDYNILVEGQSVTGVIDFGDMVYSHTINELAIVVTYAILGKPDPLDAACLVIKGYHHAFPLRDAEIQVLFRLILMRLCASIAISAEAYRRNPENQYLLVSQAPVWEMLQVLEKVDPEYASARFYEACGIQKTGHAYSIAEILDYRHQHLGKTLSVSYRKPLKIVRGQGQYLFNEHGERFLDMVNNVCHVGHCHPRVVEAGQRQMALLNTNTRYLHDNIVEYSRRLLASLPSPLSVLMFVNSGSEANELALRLARCHTGARDIITVAGAYHGNTQGCIDISPYKFDGPGGQGAPDWVHKVSMPDPYRGLFKGMTSDTGRKYAKDLEQVIAKLVLQNRQLCAFICESLQGVGGQIIMPPDYLQQAYAYVRDAGGVCIADEVQVGFGRAGTHMWAFETQDVVPDIVTMGKPIGNGHPMAAVAMTAEIAGSFVTGMEYFNTFGGNPVSCAIGLAVLNVIHDEGLMNNANDTGRYLRDGLVALQQRYPLIGDVRGVGLFIGVEFVKDRETLEPAADILGEFVERMRDQYILLSTDGPLHNVLKIKPPIVFSRENTDEFLNKMDETLTKML